MNFKISLIRAAGAGILAVGFAQASAADAVATVTQIQGVALVNQGTEYVNAKSGMPLYEGDRVMAMEGGSAELTFADGCKLNVPDNQVVSVGTQSSCATGTVSQRAVGPYLAAAPAVAGGAAAAGMAAAGVLAAAVIVGAAGSDGSSERAAIAVSP
jgi:hypothetical protein